MSSVQDSRPSIHLVHHFGDGGTAVIGDGVKGPVLLLAGVKGAGGPRQPARSHIKIRLSQDVTWRLECSDEQPSQCCSFVHAPTSTGRGATENPALSTIVFEVTRKRNIVHSQCRLPDRRGGHKVLPRIVQPDVQPRMLLPAHNRSMIPGACTPQTRTCFAGMHAFMPQDERASSCRPAGAGAQQRLSCTDASHSASDNTVHVAAKVGRGKRGG